jgi:hypothetical protein
MLKRTALIQTLTGAFNLARERGNKAQMNTAASAIVAIANAPLSPAETRAVALRNPLRFQTVALQTAA